MELDNPLLREYLRWNPHIRGEYDSEKWLKAWRARYPACRQFSWAIPNDAAIQLLVDESPIVEIGAGTGYWAWLVEQAGGKVTCYDRHVEPNENSYHGKPSDLDEGEVYTFVPTYHEILDGGPEMVGKHRDSTLFLCWPPYNDIFAAICIGYEPQRVVYVGEGHSGCTGSKEFHDLLDDEYEVVKEVYIPQWDGIHDELTLYRRK